VEEEVVGLRKERTQGTHMAGSVKKKGLNPPKLSEQDEFFRAGFNTKLKPDEEQAFRAWALENKRDPDMETIDYDLRGFWKNGGAFAGNGHASDQYKKPNHPTFSVESMWHNTPNPSGGRYVGGVWLPPDDIAQRRGAFAPSTEMLNTTHPRSWLEDYMKKYESDYDLALPRGLRQ
jgi:hypothetical protein